MEEKQSCLNCGEELIPDLESKNFVTGMWNGHTYYCVCFKDSELRISIG